MGAFQRAALGIALTSVLCIASLASEFALVELTRGDDPAGIVEKAADTAAKVRALV